MKIGIVRFPASNCDYDTLNYFRKYGHESTFIWYKNSKFVNFDLLVLPGGFAFGDRIYQKATAKYSIDPGAMALDSPVMKLVHQYAKRGLPILGICNGFQILVKAGLLPGKLVQNNSKQFFCDYLTCKITGQSFFGDQSLLGKILEIPVAHGYGKYIVDNKEYQELEKNGQIFLQYESLNPNGSVRNIAGVCNKKGNIFGMMPHPERSHDNKYFMEAIEKYVKK